MQARDPTASWLRGLHPKCNVMILLIADFGSQPSLIMHRLTV
jgi:hypothetical protein